jgi:uncharacterized protein YcbK (DUF882 family)
MMAASAVMPLLLGGQARAQSLHPSGFWERERTVWLRRPLTGEEIRATYWAQGRIVPDEYVRLCWFLRDPGMQKRIDSSTRAGRGPVPRNWHAAVAYGQIPLDVLYALNGWLEHFKMERPIIVTSAFRHQLTNASTEGAARNSQHTRGQAVDIVIPGVEAERVGLFAQWLRAGGVGFYPSRGFTHIDGGSLRSWRG